MSGFFDGGSMLVERSDDEVVSERLDRAASGVACFLASLSVVGTLRLAHLAYGACPWTSDVCAPAVVGMLFGGVMSLALGGGVLPLQTDGLTRLMRSCRPR